MNLRRVTITGADDSTSIPELVDLSLEYPWVEWGILVSKKQEGRFRFPGRHWIERLSNIAARNTMRLSTHVCGAWTRNFLRGELAWSELPSCVAVSRRIQINTHAELHASTAGMWTNMNSVPDKEFIFQWDGVNNHLAYAALGGRLQSDATFPRVSVLFDTSGGAGVLPEGWPSPPVPLSAGYAGGLGPDNVVEQVEKIELVCKQPYWIDMERRVRAEDDSALDMEKVRVVLRAIPHKVDVDGKD